MRCVLKLAKQIEPRLYAKRQMPMQNLYAAFSVLLAVCTVLYFCAFLWAPKLFNTVIYTDNIWEFVVSPFRLSVAIGMSALMLLGFKEVWYMVAGERLGTAYDDYIGVAGFVIAIFSMREFERAGKILAHD
jgi:hypothetical protein